MAQEIDLSPQELDIVLYSGDGARFRLVVTDKDDQPAPLTGVIEAQIRTKRGLEGDPSAEFSVDMTEAANGVAILALTGAQTQALAPTRKFVGVWDVQWTPVGSEPRTLCQGKVECDLDVSR
jgi:hypothetical protein